MMRICETPGCGRKQHSKGLCGACYQRKRAIENPEKILESVYKWRAKNPEKCLQDTQQWRVKNKEHIREYMRKWRSENIEKVLERNRKWRVDNPEKVRESERKIRLAKNNRSLNEKFFEVTRKQENEPNGNEPDSNAKQ